MFDFGFCCDGLMVGLDGLLACWVQWVGVLVSLVVFLSFGGDLW